MSGQCVGTIKFVRTNDAVLRHLDIVLVIYSASYMKCVEIMRAGMKIISYIPYIAMTNYYFDLMLLDNVLFYMH